MKKLKSFNLRRWHINLGWITSYDLKFPHSYVGFPLWCNYLSIGLNLNHIPESGYRVSRWINSLLMEIPHIVSVDWLMTDWLTDFISFLWLQAFMRHELHIMHGEVRKDTVSPPFQTIRVFLSSNFTNNVYGDTFSWHLHVKSTLYRTHERSICTLFAIYLLFNDLFAFEARHAHTYSS